MCRVIIIPRPAAMRQGRKAATPALICAIYIVITINGDDDDESHRERSAFLERRSRAVDRSMGKKQGDRHKERYVRE